MTVHDIRNTLLMKQPTCHDNNLENCLSQKNFTPEEEAAAVTIQRAFRYSRPALRAAVRQRAPLSDEDAVRLNLEKRGRSDLVKYIPRPRPGINAINWTKAMQWVEAHPPAIRHLAQQFLDCLIYRSHEQFEKQLQTTLQDFNRRLASLPENKRNYIILLNHTDKHSPGNGVRSEAWVQLIALKYLDVKHLIRVFTPDEIFKVNNNVINLADPVRDEVQPVLELCHNIFFCDDATYSGRQNKSRIIPALATGKEIFLAIPFMTQLSIEEMTAGIRRYRRIKDDFPKNNKTHICNHRVIPTFKGAGFCHAGLNNLSPLILNHKIACSVSVPAAIFLEGITLNTFSDSSSRSNDEIDIILGGQVKSPSIPFLNEPHTLPVYKQIKSAL